MSSAVALANLDIFEREGLNQHVLDNEDALPRAPWRSCATCRSSATSAATATSTASSWSRTRRPSETFNDDESERLLRGFLSKALFDAGLVLPGRRPRRPGHPARAAADLRPVALRRDRADPALRADRGLDDALTDRPRRPTAGRRSGGCRRSRSRDRAVLDAVLDAGRVAHVAVRDDDGQPTSCRSPTPGTATRAVPRLDREPAVPRPRRRCADLPHGHAARRPGGGALGRSSRRCTTARRWCSAAAVLTGDDKLRALQQVVSEHLMPGRWADARPAQPQGAGRDAGPRAAAGRVVGEGQRRAARRRRPRTSTCRSGPACCRCARSRASRCRHPTCAALRRSRRTSASGPVRDTTGLSRAVALARHRRRRLGAPRRRCPATCDVDVAVVGAGYTGLWTAYYLARADPTLRVVVLEREVAGFGASGRNGGWCSALFPASLALARASVRPRRGGRPCTARCTAPSTRSAGWRPPRASTATSPRAAPSSSRAPRRSSTRARAEVAEARAVGLRRGRPRAARRRRGPALGWPRPACSARRTRRTARRSTRPGWCAAWPAPSSGSGVHDPRADAGRRRSSPASCDTAHGDVRAEVVVRATEGYTPQLPGLRRRARAGLLADGRHRAAARRGLGPDRAAPSARRSADHRHLIIYGQRTADGRLAFGGRGAPYHFGSRIRPALRPRRRAVFAALRRTLRRAASRPSADARVHPRVGRPARHRPRLVRRRSGSTAPPGLAWAGGYVGDGVATTNLAGRTLADLVLRPRHRPGRGCRGSDHRRRAGSPSRCAGSASARRSR